MLLTTKKKKVFILFKYEMWSWLKFTLSITILLSSLFCLYRTGVFCTMDDSCNSDWCCAYFGKGYKKKAWTSWNFLTVSCQTHGYRQQTDFRFRCGGKSFNFTSTVNSRYNVVRYNVFLAITFFFWSPFFHDYISLYLGLSIGFFHITFSRYNVFFLWSQL